MKAPVRSEGRMTSAKFRPTAAHAQTPGFLIEPPKLKEGQERRKVAARPDEDLDEMLRRIATALTWAPHVVGRPVRVGNFWMFVVAIPKEAARG